MSEVLSDKVQSRQRASLCTGHGRNSQGRSCRQGIVKQALKGCERAIPVGTWERGPRRGNSKLKSLKIGMLLVLSQVLDFSIPELTDLSTDKLLFSFFLLFICAYRLGSFLPTAPKLLFSVFKF
jgi:hypothetical protein